MTMQPAGPRDGTAGAEYLLFTRGARLGWTFRGRRRLIARYDEPEPDPQPITAQLAARRAKAQRAWSFSLKWARPILPLAMVHVRRLPGSRGGAASRFAAAAARVVRAVRVPGSARPASSRPSAWRHEETPAR